FFPRRRHLEAGVRVALGSDVGAGTGFNLLKEGVQSYFMQQLDPTGGVALDSAHLLHLATSAGAEALALDEVGDLSWASASTPCSSSRSPASRSTSASGMPATIPMPWPRSSPWAPRATSPECGSTANSSKPPD